MAVFFLVWGLIKGVISFSVPIKFSLPATTQESHHYELTSTATARVPMQTSQYRHRSPPQSCLDSPHCQTEPHDRDSVAPGEGGERGCPYHGHGIDVLLTEQRLEKRHCTLRGERGETTAAGRQDKCPGWV